MKFTYTDESIFIIIDKEHNIEIPPFYVEYIVNDKKITCHIENGTINFDNLEFLISITDIIALAIENTIEYTDWSDYNLHFHNDVKGEIFGYNNNFTFSIDNTISIDLTRDELVDILSTCYRFWMNNYHKKQKILQKCFDTMEKKYIKLNNDVMNAMDQKLKSFDT